MLKKLTFSIRKYCENSNVPSCSFYWVVKNSQEVVADLRDALKGKRAKSIETHDFATLYTKLKLADLSAVFREIFNFVFYNSEKKYICLPANFTKRSEATWASTRPQDEGNDM